MQITMFKGLLPVSIPDSWVADPNAVRFATRHGHQLIDFRPNGGKAVECWVDNVGPDVYQHVTSVTNDDDVVWGGPENALYVESRQSVALFGQSHKVVTLT